MIDVIEKAGGLLEDANISKVNLAYKIDDGDKIYIPSILDTEEVEILEEEAGIGVIETVKTSSEKININKATRSRT